MPGTATMEMRCARRSSAVAWKSSLARRSSRSRPTNGASRPAARPPPFRAATTRSARHNAIGSLFPFSCVLAGAHVRDRCFGRALRRVPDEHAPRVRFGLDARGGVDEIAGDHALPFGPDGDGSLPGEHPGASAQCRIQVGDTGDEVERSADGALGVVLLRDGCAPDGHDRVPDELLDRAAVALDGRARLLEVAGEQLAGVLCVASLGGGREADEVREQDGDEAALGCRGCSRRRSGWRCCRRCERRPALATELDFRSIRRAA